MKVIGISGSPRPGKDTEFLVKTALEAVKEKAPTIETELIVLGLKKFSGCIACDHCKKEFNCSQKDDLSPILEILKAEDIKGMIIGSPVYMGSMTAQTKAFLDRTVMFRRNNFHFKHTVGAAVTIGGSRNGGQDLTLMNIHAALMIHNMIIVPDANPTSHFGGTAWSKVPEGIENDKDAMDTAKNTGYSVAELIQKLNS